jgi:hypothetical protein
MPLPLLLPVPLLAPATLLLLSPLLTTAPPMLLLLPPLLLLLLAVVVDQSLAVRSVLHVTSRDALVWLQSSPVIAAVCATATPPCTLLVLSPPV